MTSKRTESRDIFSLGCRRGENEKHTEWDVELGGKLDTLADLDYPACGRMVPKTLEMENENGWKRLDEDLLARIRVARAGLAVLHGLRLGDTHEGVLDSKYRVRLQRTWKLVTAGRTSKRTEQREKRHEPERRDGVIASLLW